MKHIIIIGASSGIGYHVAELFARKGWRVGVAARRTEPLKQLHSLYPDNIQYLSLDVTDENAAQHLDRLITMTGGMDIILITAGTGWNNPELITERDSHTLAVNVDGFTRIVNAAYAYYRDRHLTGQIAAVTSIAGTKGIGISATYSASKAYQSTYLQAIDQLAHQQGVRLTVTEIRPGFIDTALLDTSRRDYPMLMKVENVAPKVVRAILKRRHRATIDFRWNILTAIWRHLPRPLWRHLRLH